MIAPDRMELCEIRMPLREPFRISSGVTDTRRALLVRLRDRDGAEGWGECVAGERPHYSPETVDTAWLAITQWIAPLVLGRDFPAPADLYDLLDRSMRGHRMVQRGSHSACSVHRTDWRSLPRRRYTPAIAGSRSRSLHRGIARSLRRCAA